MDLLTSSDSQNRVEAWAERAVHVALGVSVLSWGPLSLLDSAPADRVSPVRITLFCIHIVVGVLFATRSRLQAPMNPLHILWAVPSLLAAGMAFRLSPPPHAWPMAASIVFAVFGAASLLALLTLGRSFTLLPAKRDLVTRGPYRWVRHPAYAAELIMVGAACFAAAQRQHVVIALSLFALGTFGFVIRIRQEERLLSADPTWASYAAQVRYRLVPGLY